jgi:hypothetical protein
LHYIYHRLAEKTDQRRLRRLIHQAGDLLNAQLAGLRDARDLPERGRRRQVVIQPAGRGVTSSTGTRGSASGLAARSACTLR